MKREASHKAPLQAVRNGEDLQGPTRVSPANVASQNVFLTSSQRSQGTVPSMRDLERKNSQG